VAFSLFGFQLDFSAIFETIKRFLGPFGKLLDQIKQLYDHVVGILDAAEKLKDSIIGEVVGWKNFKQDIRLKQRVVNLESAVQKTRDLIEGIPAAWRSIQDLVKQFRTQIEGGNPVEDAEAAVEDVESSGFKALLEKFPQLAKILEKALGVGAILLQAAEAIANGIDDVQTIVDELKRLRLEIERLDTVFLQQANKRKRLKLADGSTIRIRLGKLHQSA
jgi:regulator of replication initiation timing